MRLRGSPQVRRPLPWLAVMLLMAVASRSERAPGEELPAASLGWLTHIDSVWDEANWDDLQLVMQESFEPTETASGQPLDVGASRIGDRGDGRLTEAEALLAANFLASVSEPELPSGKDAVINSPSQIERLESLTQRSQLTAAATAPLEIVPASSFALSSAPDATQTLTEVATTQTVRARKRSQLAMDPRIRGYYPGQIVSLFDGGLMMPVRSDLDATFGRVDQALLGNVQVISGPYGVQYGSGFAFLVADTVPTPRYENGPQTHLRLGTQVRSNGGQTYNTATLYGGTESTGYQINAGFRKGSDYEAGNELDVPSSYEALNVYGSVGHDWDDDLQSVTRFGFVDQGPTEYAAQFFDLNQLSHYSLSHSLIHQDDSGADGFRVDVWFNDTTFNGDTDSTGKRREDFPVLNRVDAALAAVGVAAPADATFDGLVDGQLTAFGSRGGVSQGLTEDIDVGLGVDFRYTQQRLRESFDLTPFNLPNGQFQTGMPTSEIYEPGVYAEASLQMRSWWTVSTGSRASFTTTRADGAELRANSNFKNPDGQIDRDLDAFDLLGAAFLTNEFELNRHLRAKLGGGYAERIPSLTDRYSDGLFLAIIQSGFSRVNGNPELEKERNFQLDARLDSDYDRIRGRFSAFHAWIYDYVTHIANVIPDPTGARLLQATNTDLATLAGFEAYGEVDLLDGLQSFAGLSYLDGRDRQIDRPLPGIYPLESRLGLRISDNRDDPRWGVEWGWLIANDQNRLGTLRAQMPATETIPLETPTPGFATSYLRGYWRPNGRINLTCGIENLFDRNYYDHLSLRLPAQGTFDQTIVYLPGITPYLGVEIDY